jgi:hypothetical protein
MTARAKPIRCAIYTRVSTDSGLDQEFNSLDAQHDAASAYIRSQAHARWTLVRTRYDDGGFSGGSTDRPARRRANLKQYATREWMDRITELALDAYRGPLSEDEAMEPFSVVLAPVKVRDMAEEYVSIKYYKMPLKEFRRITAKTGNSLRNKINSLLESMPADTQPPFAQMQEKFCSQGNATEDAPNSMEDLWDEAYSPALVRRALRLWIKLMDELNDDAGGRRAGADPITAEIQFVLGLAYYWKDCLGNNPSRWGEDPYAGSSKNQGAGPFPRFVCEAAKIIPPNFSPESWDWAIRSALDQLESEAGKTDPEN